MVDDRVEADLQALAELAPLHQPKSLRALDAARAAFPDAPHVACFDTAFHATLPDAAATYALPRAWRERWPLRRFGFHGLSHAYASRRARDLTGAERVIVCHLGAGASLCAVQGGRSVDTTMGFTPLEGLVMATRSGSVDPGLVLWLADRMPLDELAGALEYDSGLAGLSGTADMRAVLEAAAAGEARARVALDVYVHRLRAAIAAMAAAMDGVEALVLTGGVGERAARIRAAALRGLSFLGAGLDARANDTAQPDADVAAPDSPVRILVVAAREDLEIARQVRTALRTNR